MSGERGDLHTCDISSESPRFTVNTVAKFKITPLSVYRSKATLRADVGRPLIVRCVDQGSSRTLGKEKMKRATGDSCFKQCSFKGSVKASQSSSLIQKLWGRDDLELRLRVIFHTLLQRAGLWSPDCSGWSVPVSFVQYDASADGLRKCLVPNGILYGIQFHVCLSLLWGPLAP